MISGSINLVVYYEDTDFSGLVYHANYLKFFERGREHAIGIQKLRELFEQGIQFVVHTATLTCLLPVHHGDNLTITTFGSQTRGAVVQFDHAAIFRDGPYAEKTAVTGLVEIVCLGQGHKPARVPYELWPSSAPRPSS